MTHDQAMPGVSGTRYRGMEEEEGPARPRFFGPAVKVLLGLVIAVDTSLLAAPLYYGAVNPCHMVALSRASMHSNAVDEEIGISDEVNQDVFQVSSYWVRSRRSLAACAGDVGGRTLARLVP